MPRDDDPRLQDLPLHARALLAVLAERDGDPSMRRHILGVVEAPEATGEAPLPPRPVVPEVWTQIHVLDRLEAAFATLAAMPMPTRPKSFGNAMPEPVRQKFALLELFEMEQIGILQAEHEDRNRVRVRPTAAQISRMDQALRWPATYLKPYPEVSRALCLKASWLAAGTAPADGCRALRLNSRWFNRRWLHGLAIITLRLIVEKVPVT